VRGAIGKLDREAGIIVILNCGAISLHLIHIFIVLLAPVLVFATLFIVIARRRIASPPGLRRRRRLGRAV
jgi:hypothetical protein